MTITIMETADGEITTRSATLEFTYSASGAPQTLTCGNTTYLYVTNLQGDVLAILDSAGNPVMEYTYDAWGNLLNTSSSMEGHVVEYNPLRYRGYVYDIETELYYLQSRYYDPEVGRFLNADAYTSTGQGLLGNNMFAYCNNNPCNYSDSSGASPISYCNGDRNPLLIGYYGCGGGGGGGSYNGGGNSQYEDIFEELDAIKDKTLDTIGSVAEECWDVYMHENNRQQNAQMQETQLMLDGAIAIYTYLDETGIISTTNWGTNTYNAARCGKIALTYLAAPIPTLADEYLAACYAAKAVYHLFKAGMEVFQ